MVMVPPPVVHGDGLWADVALLVVRVELCVRRVACYIYDRYTKFIVIMLSFSLEKRSRVRGSGGTSRKRGSIPP